MSEKHDFSLETERILYICDEPDCGGEVMTISRDRDKDNNMTCACNKCNKEYKFNHGYPVYIPKRISSLEEFYDDGFYQ